MKVNLKPSTNLGPVPVVMVSCGDMNISNIITIAWTGTINSEPPMLSISVRKSRYSYELIQKTGEFVVNLIPRRLLEVCDGCGVVSGRSVDKFKKFSLTKEKSEKISAPRISESPVNLECVVKQTVELGTHVMFIAEIVNVSATDAYLSATKSLHIPANELVSYIQNRYVSTGETLGTYGFTAKK